MSTPPGNASFSFFFKADTLAALSHWPELRIPPVCAFTVAQWRAGARASHYREWRGFLSKKHRG